MEPIGAKIAEGRDSEIFEHGDGRVLRRAFVARDLRPEMRIMQWVRDHGYPVPEVFDAGDGWLVMERINGIDMLDAIPRSPAGLRAGGVQLAQLHEQLAAIAAPDWLPQGPRPAGAQIVHLDLHPMNVMITDAGPVVIDWANARRGDAATEVANTWALLHAGEVSGSWFQRTLVAVGRGMLLRTFLRQFDLSASKKAMPTLVEWRIEHGHYSASEQRKMRALAASFR